MAIRSNYASLRALPLRSVAAGGGLGVAAPSPSPSVPETPTTGKVPSLPVPDPRKPAELMDALIHPIRTIKGLFNWSKNMVAFDALGTITPANAPQAEACLTGASDGINLAGLADLIPFLGAAVNKRAATALTQLRPGIEQELSARTQRPLNLMWPVGGSNLSAFQELMTFDQTFKGYPDAVVQKALGGISEIDVQRLDLWDMNNPIKRQAATLFIQRPITWVPGQKPISESLKTYLDAEAQVSASV